MIVFVLFTFVGAGVADIGAELAYAVGELRLQLHGKGGRAADGTAFQVKFDTQ